MLRDQTGCTGLLIAQGLKNAGIPYVVYERDSRDRFLNSQREWGMSMHWGGDFLSKSLPESLRHRTNEIDCDPFYDSSGETGFVQCNGKTGDVILVMPGTMPRRVSRRKLRHLLATEIDIEFGKTLAHIESDLAGVTVTFDDGSTTTGGLVIGCDGSKSRVRELLIGSEASQLCDADITIINFPHSYTAEQAQHLRMTHPVFKVCYHPDLNEMYLLAILDVRDPSKPETWVFQNLMSWKGPPYVKDLQDPAERMRFFKLHGAQYAEPWRTAALGVADDTVLPIDRGQYLVPSEKFVGRTVITLAGDAAHPMLPHRGQGLNNALQDAFHLIEALKAVDGNDKSLNEAIASYEEEMISRTKGEVQISLEQAVKAHDWKTLTQSPMFRIGANKMAPAVEKLEAGPAPTIATQDQ